MKKKTLYILIADDDADDQEMLSEAFMRQKPGAIIRTVMDGKELFDFLDACPPDELPVLILLDFKMPLVTGPEVLQHLSSHPTYVSIPKLVWSSSTRTKDIEICRQMGADGYFKKPATSKEMDEFVNIIYEIFTAQLIQSKSA